MPKVDFSKVVAIALVDDDIREEKGFPDIYSGDKFLRYMMIL